MTSHPTWIAGGGIAGLAAALALAKRGVDVVVKEREAEFSNAGAGLQLGPNAVRALQAIGAWDAVEPITQQPPEIHMRDGHSGRLIKRLRLGESFTKRFGAPYRTALRADLHGALLACVRAQPRIQVKMGVPLETGEELAAGQKLYAADGVHSAQRQNMFPGRAAVSHDNIFYRALGAPPQTDLSLDCVNLWMCRGGHVVHYPAGQLLNLVHIVPSGVSREDAVLNTAPLLQSLLNTFSIWTTWPALSVPPLPTWQQGNITLIGDAAHGTLPYLAQGAAMALEDAATLLRGDNALAQRRARVQRLHRETLRAGRMYHLGSIAARARNLVLSATPDAVVLSQLKWLYGWQP